jgi:hypothetical protein
MRVGCVVGHICVRCVYTALRVGCCVLRRGAWIVVVSMWILCVCYFVWTVSGLWHGASTVVVSVCCASMTLFVSCHGRGGGVSVVVFSYYYEDSVHIVPVSPLPS